MKFTNKDQFLTHTKRHIENVSELSSVLLSFMMEDLDVKKEYGLNDKNKINFEKKLKQVIDHHDFAKLEDSPEFLKKHNLDKPFYEFLFEKTGIELIGEDREKIQRMNELDDLTTTILLKKVGFDYEERKLYRFLEHTADIVERGCNPLTKYEFGREISRASEYKRGYASEKELNLMERLENYYDNNLMLKQEIFMEDLKNMKSKTINEPRFDIEHNVVYEKKQRNNSYKKHLIQ